METTRPCWDCCRWRRDRPTKACRRILHRSPSPSATLLHTPSCLDSNSSFCCSLCSPAMTSAQRRTASLCTRERDTCGCDKAPWGVELNFSHHCQPPGGSAPCLLNIWVSLPALYLPQPQPLICFAQKARQDPRTPEDRRPPRPGLLFVMSAVQHTFRAINNMYFDLAVHSS